MFDAFFLTINTWMTSASAIALKVVGIMGLYFMLRPFIEGRNV